MLTMDQYEYIRTHYCPVKKMLDTRMSQLGWATEAFLIRRSILEN